MTASLPQTSCNGLRLDNFCAGLLLNWPEKIGAEFIWLSISSIGDRLCFARNPIPRSLARLHPIQIADRRPLYVQKDFCGHLTFAQLSFPVGVVVVVASSLDVFAVAHIQCRN